MADMISRAAAIAKVEKARKAARTLTGMDFVMMLKDQPAVDAAPVVRCAYCKHCFDLSSDPMEPYDGESEWYCERFDRDTSAYEIDPYRFFCADGERRDDDALSGR